MKENPLNLTDEQIAAVLDLGAHFDQDSIREDILTGLFRLDLIDLRADGMFEFTDLGKEVHEALFRPAA